jgi:hypothetical protein
LYSTQGGHYAMSDMECLESLSDDDGESGKNIPVGETRPMGVLPLEFNFAPDKIKVLLLGVLIDLPDPLEISADSIEPFTAQDDISVRLVRHFSIPVFFLRTCIVYLNCTEAFKISYSDMVRCWLHSPLFDQDHKLLVVVGGERWQDFVNETMEKGSYKHKIDVQAPGDYDTIMFLHRYSRSLVEGLSTSGPDEERGRDRRFFPLAIFHDGTETMQVAHKIMIPI